MRSLGAVSVRMSPPEVYQAMQRGTIDGALFPLPSIISYDLTDLVHSFAPDVNFGGIMLTYSIGEARWRSLTDEQRTIIEEEAGNAIDSGCKKLDGELESAIRKIKAAGAANSPSTRRTRSASTMSSRPCAGTGRPTSTAGASPGPRCSMPGPPP